MGLRNRSERPRVHVIMVAVGIDNLTQEEEKESKAKVNVT